MAGILPLALHNAAHAATGSMELSFILHASFFSTEAHMPRPLDPHVFVKDAAAKAGIGPQNIRHVAGFRPAWVAGPFDAELFNAQGKGLGFSLADWFAAKGSVRITPSGNDARLDCRFTRLRPNGVYSLFENHFDQKPIGFTPLDGAARHNSFTADANGSAAISLLSPQRLTHANAVLLVYHSDNRNHGQQRGEIGVTAHHQIIARIPA
ncbi:MAG: hypothetical protein KGJ41_03690 [Rhodospirillales bacterium]|nr:hypothetical protein [Rhodospirillales bacterium]